MTHHVIPIRTYLLIFAALLVLLGLTVGVAFFNLGPFSLVAALTIAFAKAILIVLFFMHVRYSERLVQIFAGAALLWLVFMVILTMTDYIARSQAWPPNPDTDPLSTLVVERL